MTLYIHRHDNDMMAGLNNLTFVEMVTRFPNEASAMSFLEAMRWPTGPVCSHCGCTDVSPVASKRARPIFYCCGCKKQFSVTTGTVMEDSKIPLHKWCWPSTSCARVRKASAACSFIACSGLPTVQLGTFPTESALR